MKSYGNAGKLLGALFLSVWLSSIAAAQTLRVVTYNIDADTGGSVGQIGGPDAGPGLSTVLQAIGIDPLNGHQQPIDVLALEELNIDSPTSAQTTLNFIVQQLNLIYGAGMYAADPFVPDTTGGTGGGPSGMIYNTHTVTDLGAVQVGQASSAGAPRAPVRYLLKPLGGAAYTQFYLYVSHAKASSGSSNANRRNIEAQALRTDAATLGANAHIIYAGDFNFQNSSEPGYQTMVAATGSPGQALDTLNPANNWAESSSQSNSAFWPLLSESATSMTARFDFQFVTAPATTLPGLQLVPGTLGPFGNNGSAGYNHSVTSSSNTALTGMANRSTILTDLTTVTDHLPVVADYTIVPPGDFNRDMQVTAADLSGMASALTNLSAYEAATGLTSAQVQLIGDVNQDGKFTSADLQSLLLFLKNGHGTETTVPEPGSILLLAIGCALMLNWKRKRPIGGR